MNSVSKMTDDELVRNILSLNSKEVGVVASVLTHLIEIDKRRLYLAKGYSSLFSYCVSALNYCDGMAGRRVTAARCISNFPRLLDLFMEQKVTLTTISLISKILTKENFRKVISAVSNKGKSEVERYVASYLPERRVKEGIKVLPSLVAPSLPSAPVLNFSAPKVVSLENNKPPKANEKNESLPTEYLPSNIEEVQTNIEPNYEIKLKATNAALKKLRRIQELRGKKESLGELFELLMDTYLEKHSPEAREVRREKRLEQRSKKVENPKPGAPKSKVSRYIPPRIKDKLHREYKGQCAYVAPDGTRCGCRTRLEVDHIYPHGLGGSNKIENLRLLCRAHNRFAAEKFYGKQKMLMYTG